jgi:type I restriction-modification system DNA methylase subunit
MEVITVDLYDLYSEFQATFFEELDRCFYDDRLRGGLLLSLIYDDNYRYPFQTMFEAEARKHWDDLKKRVDREIRSIYETIDDVLADYRSDLEDDEDVEEYALGTILELIRTWPENGEYVSFFQQINNDKFFMIDSYDDLMNNLDEWR